MTARPDVTVVIPTHNRAHLVGQAIRSALVQESVALEVIVADDGSVDDTRAEVKRFAGAATYVHLEQSGLEAARNCGLRMAQGRYVQFLDDDDILVGDKLKQQVRFLDRHPEVDIALCPWCVRSTDGRLLEMGHHSPTGDLAGRLLIENFAPIHAFLFRKRDLYRIGGFDPDSFKWEDWDLLLRLALAGCRFDMAGETGAVYQMHDGNMMHGTGEIYRWALFWQVRNFCRLGIDPFASAFGRIALATHLLDKYTQSFRQGLDASAERALRWAIELDPEIVLRETFFEKLFEGLAPARSIYFVDVPHLVAQPALIEARFAALWEAYRQIRGSRAPNLGRLASRSRDALWRFLDQQMVDGIRYPGAAVVAACGKAAASSK